MWTFVLLTFLILSVLFCFVDLDKDRILERKIVNTFQAEEIRKKVREILYSYGNDPNQPEVVRVRLAILKLSGADPLKVEANTEMAKDDYRDVLLLAEKQCWQYKEWLIGK